MSTRTTTTSATWGEKQGLRTPKAGYMGHVPGMISLNLHGAVWRDLVLQDPLLNPQSRPASARVFGSGAQTARVNKIRPMSAQSPTASRFLEPQRLPAKLTDMQWVDESRMRLEELASDGTKENRFLPRMDRKWSPPIVGYGGHMPGYASGNLHGHPWKVVPQCPSLSSDVPAAI